MGFDLFTKRGRSVTAAFCAVILVFLIAGVGLWPAAGSQPVRIVIDGREVFFALPPYVENGWTMVPLRFFVEGNGGQVEWDGSSKSATAVLNGRYVRVTAGQRVAVANGREELLPLPAVIAKDRMFVPLRFLAVALGGTVTWDAPSSTAFVQFPPGGALSSAEKLREVSKAARSVVFIKTYDKKNELLAVGSGFITRCSGVILTNYHVISGAYSAEAVTYDGKSFPVKGVLAYDASRDVAVLKIDGRNLPVAVLGSSSELADGVEVAAVGNPEGLQNAVSLGVVSRARVNVLGQDFIQFTAPIGPGSSGGALFNLKGEVVGITTLTRREGQNINFAIPVDEVKDMAAGSGKEIPLPVLALEGEKKLSLEELADILYKYYNRFVFGDGQVEFYDVWVKEEPGSGCIYVGLFLDNRNYTSWLKAELAGARLLEVENWFLVIASRVRVEYPGRPVAGVVRFHGVFHGQPRGFPPEALFPGGDGRWLVNFCVAEFYYSEGGEMTISWH